MSERFGRVSPTQALLLKVRWIVGGLLALVVLLMSSLVYIALPGNEVPPTVSAEPLPERLEDAVQHLLVPRERIEAGEQLLPSQFTTISVPRAPGNTLFMRPEQLAQIRGMFSTRLLEPGIVFTESDLTAEPPLDLLPIPSGFRAITLSLAARDISAGFVRPKSRVDVLWRYRDRNGVKRIATLVSAAKVLSVLPLPNPQQGTPSNKPSLVTLLLSQHDTKAVELARAEGGVTLSLLGGKEILSDAGERKGLSLPEVLREEPAPEPKVIYEGSFVAVDPVTGREVRRVLVDGKWRQEEVAS